MYDDGFPDNFPNGKSLIVKDTERIPLIAEKGRHISGVIGVRRIPGIIVQSRMTEMIAAISRLMYMTGIKIAGTGRFDVRQSENFRLHQHASVGGMIKFYCAA